jgi:hypothetical protein
MPHFTPHQLHERVILAPLRTLQIRASAPVINRHVVAIQRGRPLPRIRVGDGTILDGGLHWYVAIYVLGLAVVTETANAPSPDLIRYSMRQVIFESLDWENMTGRRL